VRELDPRHAIILAAKIERHTGSQLKAIRHFEDAVRANPSDVDALFFLSVGYGVDMGKPEAARAVADRLNQLDPLTVAWERFTPSFGSFAEK
jgi:hypothetical protein